MQPLNVIIEDGCHFLQSPNGDKIPRIVSTKISQYLRNPGSCEFDVMINMGPEYCTYEPVENTLKMPSGEVLPVSIEFASALQFDKKTIDTVRAHCKVVFPYQTQHKTLIPAPEPITNNQ